MHAQSATLARRGRSVETRGIKLLAPDLVDSRTSLHLVNSQTIQFEAIHVDTSVRSMIPCEYHTPVCALSFAPNGLEAGLVSFFLVCDFPLLWRVGVRTAEEGRSPWDVDVDRHVVDVAGAEPVRVRILCLNRDSGEVFAFGQRSCVSRVERTT